MKLQNVTTVHFVAPVPLPHHQKVTLNCTSSQQIHNDVTIDYQDYNIVQHIPYEHNNIRLSWKQRLTLVFTILHFINIKTKHYFHIKLYQNISLSTPTFFNISYIIYDVKEAFLLLILWLIRTNIWLQWISDHRQTTNTK